MGRKNNVNPAHYKNAGRELPGQDIDQNVNRQRFAEARAAREARELGNKSKFIPGQAQDPITSPATEEDSSETSDEENES